MSKLKNSIIALAVLVIMVGALAALMPLIGLGQAVPGPAKPPPPLGKPPSIKIPGNFYLTKTIHNGAQALTACATGYHMASVWEIYDPSNLKYNRTYGLTLADSGYGPPNRFGWIRTGLGEENNYDVSQGYPGNCLAWKSADASEVGSSFGLGEGIKDQSIRPWSSRNDSCNTKNHVWCVKD